MRVASSLRRYSPLTPLLRPSLRPRLPLPLPRGLPRGRPLPRARGAAAASASILSMSATETACPAGTCRRRTVGFLVQQHAQRLLTQEAFVF